MDKIVVMEQGKIVAEGSHKELAGHHVYYKKRLKYF
ncbi:MAG: ATP-binding cassette subfamily C protein CydC [Colwellia sp.]|jgi:ATP-binding cassette subfamily C protein CydC